MDVSLNLFATYFLYLEHLLSLESVSILKHYFGALYLEHLMLGGVLYLEFCNMTEDLN